MVHCMGKVRPRHNTICPLIAPPCIRHLWEATNTNLSLSPLLCDNRHMTHLDSHNRRPNRNIFHKAITARPSPIILPLISPTIQLPIRRQMCNANRRYRLVSLVITTLQQAMVSPKLHLLHLDLGISPTTHRPHHSEIINTRLNTNPLIAHITLILFRHNLAQHHTPLRLQTLRRTAHM
jgi:hypothetical protein